MNGSAVIEPPWKQLDRLIVPLVRLLYKAGIETSGSCQGGRHSPFATPLPWVSMACSRAEFPTLRDRVARALVAAEWTGFTIRHLDRFDYQHKVAPWKHDEALELEVWTLKGQPGVGELLDLVARERGQQSEDCVARAFESIGSPPWPDWVLSARMATPEEGMREIDAVVESDVGPLYLQVKSSRSQARKGKDRRWRKRIGTVVIRKPHRTEGHRAGVIHMLTMLRTRILEEREARRKVDARNWGSE